MGTSLPSYSLDSVRSDRAGRSRPLAARWRRLLAFIVDCAILSLIGLVLGLFFFNLFSRFGPWARVVGFLVSLAYFALMESSVGGGQSLGKLWLKIAVVDAQGNPIPFEKAAARFAIFATPWFLSGLPLPVTRTPWLVSYAIVFAIVVVGGATLYLLLFNGATGQGLHDLAVGSYVASTAASGPVDLRPFWNKHWIAVGLMPALAIAACIFAQRMSVAETYPELTGDLQFVERLYGVQRGAAFAKTTYGQDGNRSNDLEIDAYFDEALETPSAEAGLIARHILQNDARARAYDSIRVVIAREYDIGIFRAYTRQSFDNSPEEWSRRVLDTPLRGTPEEAEK